MTDHSHKQFLRRNDFATLVGESGGFFSRYKTWLAVTVVAVVLGFAGTSFLKAERLRQNEEFSARFFEAGQGLKKVQNYQSLIRDYKEVPAVQLARLNLADKLAVDKKMDEALKTLDEGLAATKESDLFTTLLVFKKVALLRGQDKFAEALKALDGGAARLMPGMEDAATLLRADLTLQTGKKEDARQLYTSLIKKSEDFAAKAKEKAEKDAASGKKSELPASSESVDENILKQAKDQLYLLDVGLL